MAPNAETQQSDSDQGQQPGDEEGGPYLWDNQLLAHDGLIGRKFGKHSANTQKQAAMKILKFMEDADYSKYTQVNEMRDMLYLLVKAPGTNKVRFSYGKNVFLRSPLEAEPALEGHFLAYHEDIDYTCKQPRVIVIPKY